MKVGDKVRLKEFPSWGVCEVTQVHIRGTEQTYRVERYGSPGITLLSHVTLNQLTAVEEKDGNR